MNDVAGSSRTIRDELVRRAAILAPLLREHAAEGERDRRVPRQTVAALRESGILRVCQPARFGGQELGWDALCELTIELARGDGSQAWVANIYAEHAMFTGLFPEQCQREVWADSQDVLISASILPQGNKIEPVEGGYRLNGRWAFASGVNHADWVMLADFVKTGAEPPVVIFLLTPAATLVIEDDWHTMGMAGTGSASVVAKDLFIPAHRSLSNLAVMAGEAPGTAFNPAPVYRMPIMAYAQLALAAVPIGVAAGMVDDFTAFIKGRAQAPAGELLQEVLAEASAAVHAARLLVVERARHNMDVLAEGGRLVEADAAISMRDSGYAIQLTRRAAQRLFEATGGHGLYLSAPMQRAFRDVMGGGAHGSLNWPRSALRYAKAALT